MSIEALKEQARAHEQNEEWEKALQLYVQAIQRQGSEDQPDLGLYNRAGDLSTRLGNLEGALEYYDQAVKLYLDSELPNNAIAILKKILRNMPYRTDVFLQMGKIRAQQGFLVDARENFLRYAEIMQQEDKLDDARTALVEFAELAPTDLDVQNMVVAQLLAAEQTEAAVDHLGRTYRTLLRRGEDEAAMAVADRLREIAPDSGLPTDDGDYEGFETTSLAGDELAGAAPADMEMETTAHVDVAGHADVDGGAILEIEPTHYGHDELSAMEVEVTPLDLETSSGFRAADVPDDDPWGAAAADLDVGMGSGAPAEAVTEDERAGGPAAAPEPEDGLAIVADGADDALADGADDALADVANDGLTDADGEDLSDFATHDDLDLPTHGWADESAPEEDEVLLSAAWGDEPEEDLAAPVADERAPDEDDAPLSAAWADEPEVPSAAIGPDAPAEDAGPGEAIEPTELQWDAAGTDETEDAADPWISEAGLSGLEVLPAWGADEDEDVEVGGLSDAWEEPESLDAAVEDGLDASSLDEGTPLAAEADEEVSVAGLDEAWIAIDDVEEPEAAAEPAAPVWEARSDDPGEGLDDGAAWLELAARLDEEGEAEEACTALEEAHLAFAGALQFDRALDTVNRLVERDPDTVSHHRHRADYAMRAGDRSRQLAAWLDLAAALERSGDPVEAAASYEKVLELDPANEFAAIQLAAAAQPVAQAAAPEYVDLGAMVIDRVEKTTRWTVEAEEPEREEDFDFREMLNQFKAKVAEHVDVGDVRAHYDLGTAYREMGLVDEAISEFQLALRADGKNLATYEMLGQCFMEKGQPEFAVRSLGRAAQLPHDVEDELLGIYYYLGRAHEELGQRDEAVEFYEKVFALDINFQDVTERLRSLR